MKTGSEIIEVITRRRRILFAGFVARMEDTKRSRRVLLGKLIGGACCVRVQKKRASGSNADQWTTAAQN